MLRGGAGNPVSPFKFYGAGIHLQRHVSIQQFRKLAIPSIPVRNPRSLRLLGVLARDYTYRRHYGERCRQTELGEALRIRFHPRETEGKRQPAATSRYTPLLN
jgi:hypothetical protein